MSKPTLPNFEAYLLGLCDYGPAPDPKPVSSRYDDIARALAAADWSNVSIGNKGIILAAIDALGTAHRALALNIQQGREGDKC